jgi:PAS domain-containing protein
MVCLATAGSNKQLAAGGIIFVSFHIWQWRRSVEMRCAAEQQSSRARQAEQRFEAFMANFPAVAFIKDCEVRYRFVNEAFAAHFQRTAEEIHGMTDAELWPASTADSMRGSDLEILATGE